MWKDYAPDRGAFHQHFSGYVTAVALDQALAYYERFADEIEELLNENARIASQLESRPGRG